MPDAQMPAVEALKRFLEAFNRHDLDAIMEFFADDSTMDSPRGPHSWGARFIGKERVRAGCASRFAGLPDAHQDDDHHWVSGRMGFSEWTLAGTTPSGVPVQVRVTDHLEFREGRIVRKNSFWKIVEPQSGADPALLGASMRAQTSSEHL